MTKFSVMANTFIVKLKHDPNMRLPKNNYTVLYLTNIADKIYHSWSQSWILVPWFVDCSFF